VIGTVKIVLRVGQTWTRLEAGAREARRAGQVLLEQGFTFDSLLGSHCGIDPQHIHAHVIGEHGDSEVLTWSLATVAGMPLESFVTLRGINLSERVRQQIDGQVRGAAYTIIGGKGATYYGIGSAVARIVKVILHDQRSVMTVCLPTPEIAGVSNVTLSLPRLVGGNGVLETFPLPLNAEENSQLRESARVIRQALNELEDKDSHTKTAS
jgi:L-lactate dehydrogenase